MRKSLFRKFFSATAIILIVSYIFLGILLFAMIRNYVLNEKKSLLTSSISDISKMCGDSISEFGGVNSLYIQNQLGTASRAIESDVFITDTDGRTLICSDQYGNHPQNGYSKDNKCIHQNITISKQIIDQTVSSVYSGTTNFDGAYEHKQYLVGMPITSYDGTVYGLVYASTSFESLSNFSSAIIKIFLGSAIAVLCMSFIIIYLTTYQLVKPLKLMSLAAKQMSEGDFSTTIPVAIDNGEISDLANSFNNMSASLASLESMRRSFIANVSHELKTPMTTISGFVDGILDGTIPSESQGKYLQVVSDETKRLSRMVTTMLNLSRLDAGELQIRPSEFDIADVLVHLLLPLERMIEDKSLEIRGLDALSKTNVFADRDLITQIMYNLVDNAIKFSTPNGTVDISIKSADNKVYFTIRNMGIGISETDLPHIFDRFYKSDKSRSMDKTGTGLGLYIVKTIIDLHKGQITVRSVENEYCEFEFWIPKNADD